MRSISRLLIVAALVMGGGFAIFKYLLLPHLQQGEQIPVTNGTSALFAATFPDTNNVPQALKQWQGKVLVVNFWATWCPPCLEEMPELSKLNDEYKGQNVSFVGISTDDVAKISEFTKGTAVSYPLLAADMQAADLAEALGNNRGVLPYTVIIKTDGSIAKSHLGRINRAILQETLIPLLTSKKP